MRSSRTTLRISQFIGRILDAGRLGCSNGWARKNRRWANMIGLIPSHEEPKLRLAGGVTVRPLEIGLGLLLDRQSQLAAFVLDGWEAGMDLRPVRTGWSKIANHEPSPPSGHV
jgi:hypothetical protein